MFFFGWLHSAVQYSGIAFHRTGVFSLGATGVAILVVAVLWMQVLFVWIHRLLMEVESSGLRGLSRVSALGAGILVSLPFLFIFDLYLPWYVLGLILSLFLGLFDLFIERRVLNLTWMAVWMAVMSAGASYGLNTFSKLENTLSDLFSPKNKVEAALELDELSRQLSADDTLLTLLSTPVPFTVQEEVLRGEIASHWERLPFLSGHFDLERIMLVNSKLKESALEGRDFRQAVPWLKARQSAAGRSWISFRDSISYGYALMIPDTGSLSGNVAFLLLRPGNSERSSFSLQNGFSIFSGLFLLMVFATLAWAILGYAFKMSSLSEISPFFDKPSLRNRIQLWLAGFTLGAFLLTGWVSYTFFSRSGLMAPDTMYEYLSALLNVYVFLLLAALAVAVVVGNSITRPLTAIGEKLQVLRLARNEPLHWPGQDEIGELVSAYNRMIVEVEKSAELLRRSEREGAWREMAKQVAHEIKNPLTPMKLSIQHLQRAYQADPEKAALLIQGVSETLIEQIDTLTRIAGEFSHFAQMPAPQKEVFDLRETVRAVCQLFQAEEEPSPKAILSLHVPDTAVNIDSDRTQITRLLNNLLKNALQAIPEDRPGKIEIELRTDSTSASRTALLSIRDNGAGMPEEVQAKVFSPNFTTKNSGMGLGLAMCKNIVDACGGRIWFETAEGEGTVFFVELPQLPDGK